MYHSYSILVVFWIHCTVYPKDCAKQIYNTTTKCNQYLLTANVGSSIQITDIDAISLQRFSYNNMFDVLLNYLKYKYAFTRHIDIDM